MKFKKIFKEHIMPFIFMSLGALIAAFALEEFLVPNTILDGGITGISIIAKIYTEFPLGLFVFVFNLPFLIIGLKQLGLRFFIRGAYSMTLLSVLLELFKDINELTNETLLAIVFGGVLLGVGCGLVLRFGGCLDGTEVVALLISKKTNLSVGQIIFIVNIIIFGVAGILFGIDRALYSLLAYFITYKVIDIVENGMEQAKAVMIITDESESIAKNIYNRLGRTCTFIEAAGLISGRKDVLYCVITRIELAEIRRIIKETDGSAFVSISDVSEILGTHIKKVDKKTKKKVFKRKENNPE